MAALRAFMRGDISRTFSPRPALRSPRDARHDHARPARPARRRGESFDAAWPEAVTRAVDRAGTRAQPCMARRVRRDAIGVARRLGATRGAGRRAGAGAARRRTASPREARAEKFGCPRRFLRWSTMNDEPARRQRPPISFRPSSAEDSARLKQLARDRGRSISETVRRHRREPAKPSRAGARGLRARSAQRHRHNRASRPPGRRRRARGRAGRGAERARPSK